MSPNENQMPMMPPGGGMPGMPGMQGLPGLPMGDMPIPQGGGVNPREEIEAIKRQEMRDNEEISLTRKNVENLRREVMVSIFEDLRRLGVDPENPQSVSDFISRLERFDPDLAALFSASFEALLPDKHEDMLNSMLQSGLAPSSPPPPPSQPELDEQAGGEVAEDQSGNFPSPEGGIPNSPEEVE